MPSQFDAVVIGAGPAGEVATTRLAAAGLRVALVERELIGGECAYWACIPSKTLLRPAEVRAQAPRTAGTSAPEQRFGEVARYRDFMIRELDDSREEAGYRERGVTVFRGEASIEAPGHVAVAGKVIETERIVLATGTTPTIPPIDGLAEAGYWTNREAVTFQEVPRSVCVLGGGPVGVELAQLLRRYGADVVLIEREDRLLSREDPNVSRLVAEALRADGVELRLGAEVAAVRRAGEEERIVRLATDEELRAEQLIVATSRSPRVADLGLDRVGIEPGARGIQVDARCRAGAGIWAIGDVTGVLPFTHVAKYQARIACADILERHASADYAAIPRCVFTDPEVAAVGLTEAQAREAGLDAASVTLVLRDAIARPWTFETDPRGELGLIVDRAAGVLAGAWAVAPMASEWIHMAALSIRAGIPVATLLDSVAQFPSYSEAYLYALEEL